MEKTRFAKLSLLFLFTILIVGVASAKVIIAGTVYDGVISNPVGNILVTITCGSTVQTATSQADGAYATTFTAVDYCSTYNIVSAANSATVIYLPDGSAPVINNNGGGSSGGSSGTTHYYQCGNGKCESGETVSTCPKDCSVKTTTTGNTTITEGNGTKADDKKPSTGFFTGAVTGFVNFAKTGLGMGLLIGLLVIGGSVVFFSVRKRKKKVAEN